MKFIFIFIFIFSLVMCLSACSNVVSDVSADDTYKNADTNVITEDATKPESDTIESTDTDVDTSDTAGDPTDTNVHVTEIRLDKYEVTLDVGSNAMPLVTMLPDGVENVGEIWTSSDEKIAVVNHYGKITGVAPGECTVTVKSEDNPSVTAIVKVKVKEPKGATYIKGILIANKTYSLPSTYAPGVDPVAQAALNEMVNAAAEEGIKLYAVSSYRSYSTQATLYNNYVARDGVAAADRYSARAGHSEHQTGLAFDLNSLEQSWGETVEGKWLAANCYKYGFIIRYPKDKEGVTGYMYEPWHVRYLGKDIASDVYKSGKCLEEYLGITSKYAS